MSPAPSTPPPSRSGSPAQKGGRERIGYETTALLDPAAVAKLRQRYDEIGPDTDRSFYASSVHAPRSLAAALDEELRAIVAPFLRAALPDHDVVLAAFISKGHGDGSRVEFHQDLTYTDERVARATLAWIPLVDAGADNGTLAVVPGSHRWSDGIRASGAEAPLAGLQDAVAHQAVTVPLVAGAGILYDAALVHGSQPNRSEHRRPAVAVLLVPSGSQMVHFHQAPDGVISGHRIDGRYFTAQPYGERPKGCDPVEAWTRPVAPADFEGPLAAGATDRRLRPRGLLVRLVRLPRRHGQR